MISKSISWLLLKLIRLYQLTLSPFIGQSCRFTPTCSRYTQEAITIHGPWKGSYLGAYRILRCAPWCEGGHDPVPPKQLKSQSCKKSP